jgi:hypothetical protein
MKWTRTLELFVDVMVALWLFEIIFHQKKQ